MPTDEEFEELRAELQALKDNQAAADFYGGGAPIGGGTPPGRAATDDETWLGDFQHRFDSNEQVSVREIERYARMLGGAHLAVQMAENSQAFRRAGISPQMIRDHLEGRSRQRRPAKSGVGIPPRG